MRGKKPESTRTLSRAAREFTNRYKSLCYGRSGMKTTQKASVIVGTGLMVFSSLGLSGCDYWPPALQNEIETLRAELNDALDERQRLEMENTELKSLQISMKREVEDKARENEALKDRLSVRSRRVSNQSRKPTVAKKATLARSSIVKGSGARGGLHFPLRKGSRVKELQRLLRRHDLPIRADGIYGRDTAAAVRWFQRSKGLPVDGIAGPATFAALERSKAAPRLGRPLRLKRPRLTGSDVVRLQRTLRRKGYRLRIDGSFGPETDVAVTRFQRKHGLEPDGMVGPRTWTALTAGR